MMSDWKEVKLKELIQEMGDGGTPTTTDVANFGGDIPWVVVDDVVSDIYTTKETLTEKGFNKCSAKKWPKGSIILTTGATIGQVGIARIDLCTKQGITGIIPNEFANNIFLKFWLEANTKQLIRYAQGTTFKEIRPRSLGSIRISIPNPFTKKGLHEQTAIATILSKVDEGIKATTESIVAAEKLKKALMQNLLSGKLKPDGTWRTEDEFYEDEKFGKVPIGWEVKRIKDLSTQVTDGEHTTPRRSDNGFYLLSARNIKHGYLDLSNVDYIDESELVRIQKRCNPEYGDIFISCSGTIGNVCIVPEGLKAGMVRSAALVKLRKELIEPEFVELVLQSFPLQLQMKKSVASSVQGNLFQGAIKKLKLAVPSDKEERTSLVRSINDISINSKERQTKIKVLERLKKSLMQQLLTGKKRLSKETIAYINQTL